MKFFFGLPCRNIPKFDLPRDNRFDAEIFSNLEQFRLSMLESVFQHVGRDRVEPSMAPVLYSTGDLVMAWKARQVKRPHLEFRNEGLFRVIRQMGWKVELERGGVILKAHLGHLYPYIPNDLNTLDKSRLISQQEEELRASEHIKEIGGSDQKEIKKVIQSEERDLRARRRCVRAQRRDRF